ncbi:SpoIIE family protein phosphatase [Streptomyces sp. SID8360]|nr:response regulator receiver modulated serine phosphatase [Streptomyces sp. SirexAA-E]MYR67812.1 SpoIIE family protein phosphatase [Streptomyces sp. SID4939]MYR99347.1 SpoIIE family protein phosphatase [Streptomyces sp. SID4940]MYT67845.1 SpoIIE family protein phosphatase [Streptomyces sp. SID8357]MYT86689.1 SpoIIE family protein phosphatase [Streptomyces sp. SID8360]MYU35771.1 SpoIIE family protein phosphatase [Streptomyces sp. SID8358]MYW41405.1 SpoIIE family protein phosphatase [Streptom
MIELPLGASARLMGPTGIPAQYAGSAGVAESSVWDLGAAILLVEDDSGDALLVEEMLADSELDSTLTWCKTLAEAQRFLRSCRTPVCVLLDLHLPDSHGIDAVRQLVDSFPDAAVVVLTGLAETETGLSAVAHGAQDYLLKGRIDPQALSRAIRYALQRKNAERVASAIRTSQLIAQENARLERALLPIPLLHGHGFGVAARYEAGRAHGLLSGDFYDVVETADGAVHAVIGDVSGHGAAEAALGVCLRVAWRTAVLTGVTQLEKIGLLEEILVAERSDPHVFATVTTLVFPPERDRVRVARAGHPGMLLRRGTDVSWVEPDTGMALGLLPGAGRWTITELDLHQDSELVLFTDGLFEGRTGPHSRLGEEGLLEIARGHGTLAPQAFIDALVAEATESAAPYGGLADDVAVLHLGWEKNV